MWTVIVSAASATIINVLVSIKVLQVSRMRSPSTLASMSCTDKIKNQDETDFDCGGLICPKCNDTKVCKIARDCVSRVCTSNICQGTFILV